MIAARAICTASCRARHVVEVGVALLQRRVGALDRFVEQAGELDGLAAARLEHLAVGAEHVAEGHVFTAHALGQPARHARDGEDHLEVLGLGHAHDVEHLVGVQVVTRSRTAARSLAA